MLLELNLVILPVEPNCSPIKIWRTTNNINDLAAALRRSLASLRKTSFTLIDRVHDESVNQVLSCLAIADGSWLLPKM